MKNTKLLMLVLIISIIAASCFYFSDIVSLFAIAALIAFLLNPISKLIAKRFKMPDILSIFIVLIIMFIFIGIVLSTLLPNLINELKTFVTNLPKYFKSFEAMYNNTITFLSQRGIPKSYLNAFNATISSLDNVISDILLSLLSGAINWPIKILDIVIIITLTVYFMLDTRSIMVKTSSFLPRDMGKRFLEIIDESYFMVWKYLKYKTIISIGMAVTSFIVFSILKVDYALLLAALAFVLDYIPYFGSIIAGIVGFLVSLLTGGFTQAVLVAISILVIQQIEGNVVIPKVQGDSVGLHPIAVMFAILACNELLGPFGMFIAVPIGGVIKILSREAYKFMISD